MPAVVATGLGKTYPGDIRALENFNLTVEVGEVFALLGPNGAGKTTTVRLLNGTLEPSAGTAEVLGGPASGSTTRLKTATLAEAARLYEHLSAFQNLKFFASMYGLVGSKTESRIHDLLERMGLNGRENDKVGTYSTGMKKRAQLARVLLHEPELVFLDEPTSGLDPDAARQVTELIRTLAQDDQTTVILCTHNLPVAEKVCDIFGFLSQGRLVASGSMDALTADAGGSFTVDVVTDKGNKKIAIKDKREINAHLKRIMDAGELIHEVRPNRFDLESLYFQYVGSSDNELG